MHRLSEIIEFVSNKTGCDEIHSNDDIVYDLGCCGDDFEELIQDFATRFHVNIEEYRWYFHTEDEGAISNIGASFFKPPYERVEHIPVTPELLLQFANSGKWHIAYPPHQLPNYRWDSLISLFLLVAVIGLMLFAVL